MPTQTLKRVPQSTAISLFNTELNSMTTTGVVTKSGTITNAVGTANADGNPYAWLHLHLEAPQGGALNSNTGFAFYWLRQVGGVTETAPSAIGQRAHDVYIDVLPNSTIQDRTIPLWDAPVGVVGYTIIADTTGRTLAASGNYLEILFSTDTMQ